MKKEKEKARCVMFSWLKDYVTIDWYLILVGEINHLFDAQVTFIREKKEKL